MRLVIAAHGTRDAAGEQDARRFVERVRAALPEVEVNVGFVELSDPPLQQVMEEVAAADASPVVVVPLMLGSGGHAKRDIPGAIAAGAAANPDVHWRYAEVLGPDERLLCGLVSRIDVARAEHDADRTTVLLVGRGSSDPDSTGMVESTAREIADLGGYAAVRTAYIAVARPRIGDALADIARSAPAGTLVVVAPYLLFRGLMVDDVRSRVEAWRGSHPGELTGVVVADVLGEDHALVDLVVQRYREARDRSSPKGQTGTDVRTHIDATTGPDDPRGRRCEEERA